MCFIGVCLYWDNIGIGKISPGNRFAYFDRDGVFKHGAINNDGVNLAIFATGVALGRKILDKLLVPFFSGNVSRMANALGIGRNTLYAKLRKYQIA